MSNIIITFSDDTKKEFRKGITLKEIIKEINNDDIICGMYQGRIINYDDVLNKSGKLYLYDINTKQGNKIYEKGLLFLFEVCTKEIMGNDTEVVVRHSIDKGVYCEIFKNITMEDVEKIKKLMKEKVKKEIPFEKIETTRSEAIEYFKTLKMIIVKYI